MPHHNLEKYATSIILAAQNIEAAAGSEKARALFYIKRLLLEGCPVSAQDIAASYHMPPDEFTAFLRQIGVEFDEAGYVVGFGVSLTHTPHRYTALGRNLYVWCAADAIVFPQWYRHTATIESSDPLNGTPIRLTVTPEGITQIEPGTTVVSGMYGGTWNPEKTRETGCVYGHFFSSTQSASEYVAKHTGVVILSPDEVHEIGKLVLESEPFKPYVS